MLAVVVEVFAWCAAPRAEAAGPDARLETVNSLGMRFVAVPAGEFLMGSSDADSVADDDERPQHRVIVSSFRFAMFETTQAEFRAVMGSNPSWFCAAGGGRGEVAGVDTDKIPVDMTTWHEATEFCRKLGELPAERAAGRTYRLPTEAEWEYACRAGTTTHFSTGDDLTSRQACIFDSPVAGLPTAAKLRPQPVGSYSANRFGLHDMHGNVWEWCQDGYDLYPATASIDPVCGERAKRVARGGSWADPAEQLRSANRCSIAPDTRSALLGFRIVIDLP